MEHQRMNHQRLFTLLILLPSLCSLIRAAQPAYYLATNETTLNSAAPPSVAVGFATAIADVLLIQRHWNPTQNPSNANFTNSATASVALARSHGLKVFLSMDPLSANRANVDFPAGLRGDFTTATVRTAFQAEAVRAAQTHTPDYFVLAVEINSYKRGSPKSYAAFVALYESTRLAIAAVSPTTKVAVSLLYSAKHGSCYTAEDLKDLSDVNADFTNQDFFAVSTYPLCYGTASALPSTFINSIAAVSGKPLFISETAWLSGTSGHAPQDQVDYVTALRASADYAVAHGKTISAVTYISLADPDSLSCSVLIARGLEWYCHLGLIDSSLKPKPAYETMRSWHDTLNGITRSKGKAPPTRSPQ